MPEALVVRLRPTGPWRFGSDSGARSESGDLYHSDAVYSAVTQAMIRLGTLEDWLDATARADDEPAVRFSSLFPWQGDTLYIAPPRTVWPPVSAAMLNLRGARFLPIEAVRSLLEGKELAEDGWIVDGLSFCLAPHAAGKPEIYRPVVRSGAALDRVRPGAVRAHQTAGVQFAGNAGLWLLASFREGAAARWREPVEGAFKILADSGFGGRRSAGWGCAEQPVFETVELPGWILPPPAAAPITESNESAEGQEPSASAPAPVGYWMLSLYRPGPSDTVDWDRGRYSLVTRGGRVESPANSGALKKNVRMVAEGSVLFAGGPPVGSAPDVAPDGMAHPVFRYGFPLSIPIPVGAPA